MRAQDPSQTRLINTPHIELWPQGLLQARSNHDARLLARARHVLRRKRDGRYLAADVPEGLQPLLHDWQRGPGIDEALAALADRLTHPTTPLRSEWLPLDRLELRLQQLGIGTDYGQRTELPLVAEPTVLAFAGFDRYQRALWLRAGAARAWRRLHDAALLEDVALDAISGYRSHDYQLGIFERKRQRGVSVADILTVNAAPGYSEHHSGCALDIGTPGEPPAEESFELTPAFAWLTANAGDHGFHMSYPRNNPHGIVYEPWHWCWNETRDVGDNDPAVPAFTA